MKNIQVIDDAINCTYEIFAISDELFYEIFPNEQDVEFENDLFERCGDLRAKELLDTLWKNRLNKKEVVGIHGTIFFGYDFDDKKPFYPTKKESEMIANPPKN